MHQDLLTRDYITLVYHKLIKTNHIHKKFCLPTEEPQANNALFFFEKKKHTNMSSDARPQAPVFDADAVSSTETYGIYRNLSIWYDKKHLAEQQAKIQMYSIKKILEIRQKIKKISQIIK